MADFVDAHSEDTSPASGTAVYAILDPSGTHSDVWVQIDNLAADATVATSWKSDLGLVIGTDVQAYDATLASIASLGTAADKIAYTTGVDTWAEAALTSFARTLLDDTTAAAARTTLDVDQAGTDNSTNVTLVTTAADYLSIAGQAITLGLIDLTTDVTGLLPGANIATDLTASQVSDFSSAADARIGAAVLDDLSDVTETTITTGDLLRWNGTAWVNYADSAYGTSAAVALNTTHRTSDGSDHTFIDQSVTSGSTPTFTGTNITGVPAASILAGSLGVGNYTITGNLVITGTVDTVDVAAHKSAYDAHVADVANPHSVTKAQVGLTNVEDTALSTWAGTTNVTTLGTIATGVWQGTAVQGAYTDIDVSELTDVTITTIASGEILKWSGTAWINQTLAEAGVSATGHTHTESDITDLGATVAMVADDLSVFAATTSAQLAGVISDETGSGALVFGTSPTLVTPALGTPSALVLTNATGLPASSILAGTFGTGAYTFDNLLTVNTSATVGNAITATVSGGGKFKVTTLGASSTKIVGDAAGQAFGIEAASDVILYAGGAVEVARFASGGAATFTSYAGQSSITTVGALNSGSITSGFGNIDIGASTITTTGATATGDLTVTGETTVTNTDSTSNTIWNSEFTLTKDATTTGSVQNIRAISESTFTSGTSAGHWAGVFKATHSGAGATLAKLVGVSANIVASAGTITNAYAIDITAPTAGATISSVFAGLNIADGYDYAIYSAGGAVELTDGTITTTGTLASGAATITGTLTSTSNISVDSAAAAYFIPDRATTASGSGILFRTAGSSEWGLGTGLNGTGQAFKLINYNGGATDVLTVDYGTSAFDFQSFAITTTGTLASGNISATGYVSSTGTGLAASLRATNTTGGTGKDWHIYSLNDGGLGFYDNTGAAYAMKIDSSGNVGIGETAPDALLTLNQGAGDGPIFSAKSSDVAHGMTSLAETDTYAVMKKAEPTNGGARLFGFGEGTYGTLIDGIATTENSTKTTSGLAMVMFKAGVKSGTTVADPSANTNIFVVAAATSASTQFIVDIEGDYHYNGADGGAFDQYDDNALLRTFAVATSDPATIIRNEFDDFLIRNDDILCEIGVLGAPVSEGGLVNGAQLNRVMVGAIGQNHTEIRRTKNEVEQLRSELDATKLELADAKATLLQLTTGQA